MPKLIHLYQQLCKAQSVHFDQHQFTLIEKLQHCLTYLENKNPLPRFNPFRKKTPLHGVYVYGGVGTGKTFLMDLFFNALEKVPKLRLHFFEFMNFIHQEMALHQGMRNPLQRIARKLSKNYAVICFDEFFVKDIVDAMVFRRLFEALFSEGMMIIITSNLSPSELYKNGLQRELFFPAIELIMEKMTVFHLLSKQDYRQNTKSSNEPCFFVETHMNTDAQHQMNLIFSRFTQQEVVTTDPLMIFDRLIPCIKRSAKVAWFDFNVVCSPPRSARDYLEMVKFHRVLFVNHIPRIQPEQKNTILLLIQLIDIAYEAHVLLIASFAVELADIYQQGPFAFDFLRTQSRLQEMQSQAYAADFNF